LCDLLHRRTLRRIGTPTILDDIPNAVIHSWSVQSGWTFSVSDKPGNLFLLYFLKRHGIEKYLDEVLKSM
jgi:hypothetical protein